MNERNVLISGKIRNLLRSALTVQPASTEAAVADLAELNRYCVYGFLLSFIVILFIKLKICFVYFITVSVSYFS